MTIADIADILDAEFCCGMEMAGKEIQTGCAYDMMSDVLAYGREHAVLLTSLLNPQVIRTAEMMDIFCVIFVMGKQPTAEMIELARERALIVMTTRRSMFSACGILYTAGVPDGSDELVACC